VLAQDAQAFIGGVTFGDAAEVEEHAGLEQRDGFRLGIELDGTPVGGGESFGETVGRREFFDAFGAPPELGEIAAGGIKGTVGELGRAQGNGRRDRTDPRWL
jgi:hypothetical protein